PTGGLRGASAFYPLRHVARDDEDVRLPVIGLIAVAGRKFCTRVRDRSSRFPESGLEDVFRLYRGCGVALRESGGQRHRPASHSTVRHRFGEVLPEMTHLE